ncbi:MAG: PEP-CTERM sorting domain-containing protein [Aquabacterium sp.]|nr:MAG: PEP-CTERM sorting domain-containing protein [Aquabacterium sp.]
MTKLKLTPRLCALALACALPAWAHAATLDTADQGKVTRASIGLTTIALDATATQTGLNTAAFKGASSETRSFAWFAVPDSTQPYASVTLSLTVNQQAEAGAGHFSVHALVSSFADFQTSFAGAATPERSALFNDLADGDEYAAATAVAGDGERLSFVLGPQALAALNAARGGYFGLGFEGDGGQIVIPGVPFDTSGTLVLSGIQLEVTAVPEPQSWAMLGLGALCAAGAARRRART